MRLSKPIPLRFPNDASSLRHRRRAFVFQFVGNAVLVLLFIAWLQIPDSHIWQLACSLLVIVALVAAFLRLHVVTMQALRAPGIAGRVWQSSLLLATWTALWWCAAHIIQHIFNETVVDQRAGYWNSRLSAHLRNTFTYERLSSWQTDIAATLLWWVLPTLLLPLIVESVGRALRTLREPATWRIYRRWQLWVETAVAAWLACWVSDRLIAWQPGHSVHGELVSLVLRFAAVYLIIVVVYVAVLAIVAALLAREHSSGNPAPQPSPDNTDPIAVN